MRQIGFMNLIGSKGHSDVETYGYDTLIPTFAYDVARGIEEEAQKRGYGLLFNTQYDGQKLYAANTPPMITHGWIDGLLLVGGGFSNEFVAGLKRWKIPIVLVGSYLTEGNIDCVYADSSGGAHKAIDHLLELGHTQIGFINGPSLTKTNVDKKQGYFTALQDYNIEYDPHLVVEGDYSAQSGYACMHELLTKNRKITAVFVALDGMAIGVKKYLDEKGRRIPEDISVVGFEDSWIATHFEPPLTTVKIHKYEMGVVAVNKLFEILERRRRGKASKTLVPTDLLIRQSCIEARGNKANHEKEKRR
jgi:DNA-binding LacI/PurR family transcriptional regulator